MTADPLAPREAPTLYFIGVTTGQSSIMQVFPRWSAILGLGAEMAGYDVPLHAPAEDYRAIVQHIKTDPLARGALVTTHKIDLLEATRDLFDDLDDYADLCSEVSCISTVDGRLQGFAKDPITSGLAWEAFVPSGHWGRTGGHVLCLGAGGAAMAISIHAALRTDPGDRPPRFIAVDRRQDRLDGLRDIHSRIATDMAFDYVRHDHPAQNDRLLEKLPPGSMVINATGMGKDLPGSPLTGHGVFPQDGLVWELNYRGERTFLQQAQRQAGERNLTVEDGWIYFLHGWSQVIAEVFHIDLTPELFNRLGEAALRPR